MLPKSVQLNAARGEPPRKRVKRVYTQLQSRTLLSKTKSLSDAIY